VEHLLTEETINLEASQLLKTIKTNIRIWQTSK